MFKFFVFRFLGKCAKGNLYRDGYRDRQRDLFDNGPDHDDIDDRLTHRAGLKPARNISKCSAYTKKRRRTSGMVYELYNYTERNVLLRLALPARVT